MKKEKRERRSLWTRMKREYAQLTLRTWRMEWTGGQRLILQGGRSILLYGETRMGLSVQDARIQWIEITGRKLICLNYHPDALIVEGEIENVHLHEERFAEVQAQGAPS